MTSDHQPRKRWIILGPSPFDIFVLILFLIPVATTLLLPLIQWLRRFL